MPVEVRVSSSPVVVRPWENYVVILNYKSFLVSLFRHRVGTSGCQLHIHKKWNKCRSMPSSQTLRAGTHRDSPAPMQERERISSDLQGGVAQEAASVRNRSLVLLPPANGARTAERMLVMSLE